jgi:hypothetical protein
MERHPEVADRVPSWIDMMVESLSSCVQAGEATQQTSALLEYMRGMESRYKGQLESMRVEMEAHQRHEAEATRDAMGAQMQDGMAGIGRSVEAMGGRVQQQMMSLLATVEGAVKGSLERMDADAFGRAASERIEVWMHDRLAGLMRGQDVTSDALSKLSQHLGDELRRLHEPTTARHEHVMSVLSALPSQVTTVLSTYAGTTQEAEARAAVAGRLCELRSLLDGQGRGQEAVADQVVAIAGVMERLKGEVERMWGSVKDLSHVQETAGETMRALSQRLSEDLMRAHEPTTARHEHLLSVLSALPAQVSAAHSALQTSLNTTQEGEARAVMMEKLGELRTQLDVHARGQEATSESVSGLECLVSKLRSEVERMWGDMKERGTDQKATATQQMAQVPMLVKGVLSDMLKDVEAQMVHARSATKATQQQVTKVEGEMAGATTALAVQRKMLDDVAAKLDAMASQMTRNGASQRVKGQQGENGLYELLCDRLTSRDDYEIEMVRGQAHGCDINIRRIGHADVRLESKAHGEGTGEKVRAKEVMRFQSDLLGRNAHGIFVSLYSGIVGKGELEIEQLANGKFAVYLSNNKYDVGIIQDMLLLLYRLDKITSGAGGGSAGGDEAESVIRVTQETMRRVQLFLKDFAGKVAVTKTHLKDSLSLLSELTFDLLERMLLGQAVSLKADDEPSTPPQERQQDLPSSSSHVCRHCGKVCKKRGALTMHERACTAVRADDVGMVSA